MGGFPYRSHLTSCTWGIPVQKPFWRSAGSGVGFLPCSSLSCSMNEEIHSLVFLKSWTLNINCVWFESLLHFLSLILGLVCLPSTSYLKQFNVFPTSLSFWVYSIVTMVASYFYIHFASKIITFYPPLTCFYILCSNFVICNCGIAHSNPSCCLFVCGSSEWSLHGVFIRLH